RSGLFILREQRVGQVYPFDCDTSLVAATLCNQSRGGREFAGTRLTAQEIQILLTHEERRRIGRIGCGGGRVVVSDGNRRCARQLDGCPVRIADEEREGFGPFRI